jgi:integrase
LTGLRAANIRQLVWSRVDLDRAHVCIPAQSTKGAPSYRDSALGGRCEGAGRDRASKGPGPRLPL